VPDAGGAGQRIPLEHGGEVAELALGAPALDAAAHQRGDPGAVIAAILEAPQRPHQQRRCVIPADDADDPAHERSCSSRPGSAAHSRCSGSGTPAEFAAGRAAFKPCFTGFPPRQPGTPAH
jgi:hypothetical protein